MLSELAQLSNLLKSLPTPGELLASDSRQTAERKRDRQTFEERKAARIKRLTQLLNSTNSSITFPLLVHLPERAVDYAYLTEQQIMFDYKPQGMWAAPQSASGLRGLTYVNYMLSSEPAFDSMDRWEQVVEHTGMPLGVCAGLHRMEHPGKPGKKLGNFMHATCAVQGRARVINYWLASRREMMRDAPAAGPHHSGMPMAEVLWLVLTKVEVGVAVSEENDEPATAAAPPPPQKPPPATTTTTATKNPKPNAGGSMDSKHSAVHSPAFQTSTPPVPQSLAAAQTEINRVFGKVRIPYAEAEETEPNVYTSIDPGAYPAAAPRAKPQKSNVVLKWRFEPIVTNGADPPVHRYTGEKYTGVCIRFGRCVALHGEGPLLERVSSEFTYPTEGRWEKYIGKLPYLEMFLGL